MPASEERRVNEEEYYRGLEEKECTSLQTNGCIFMVLGALMGGVKIEPPTFELSDNPLYLPPKILSSLINNPVLQNV